MAPRGESEGCVGGTPGNSRWAAQGKAASFAGQRYGLSLCARYQSSLFFQVESQSIMPIKTYLDEQPAINLTPMIDIVFLLIIFFMVGTKFTELERKIGLKVPHVSDSGALTSAPEKKVINVHRDGVITYRGENVSIKALIEILVVARKEYEDLGVLVRGDADGPFQNVATVLNACRIAGVPEMGISVRVDTRR